MNEFSSYILSGHSSNLCSDDLIHKNRPKKKSWAWENANDQTFFDPSYSLPLLVPLAKQTSLISLSVYQWQIDVSNTLTWYKMMLFNSWKNEKIHSLHCSWLLYRKHTRELVGISSALFNSQKKLFSQNYGLTLAFTVSVSWLSH